MTVADLLALTPKQLISKLGMGVKTRRELQSRIREWRARLGAPPEDGRPPRVFAADLAQIGLDDIAALLVPAVQRTGRNATEVAATRLLLGLPDDNGALAGLPAWPQHRLVAERLDVTPARIAQVLVKQRRAWSRQPVVGNVLRELIELLAASGRVMSVGELAAALLGRRGAVVDGEELRRAIATAVVRAAVETDEVADEPRLRTRRQGDRILVALEVAEFDDPTTPPAPALLDYAYALGAAADRLAAAEVLPSSATVLRTLAGISTAGLSSANRRLSPPARPTADASTSVHPESVSDLASIDVSGGAGESLATGGMDPDAEAAVAGEPGGRIGLLDERRLVRLAAAASRNAAVTPRLEIYPRDLDAVRALRLDQAGLVSPRPGLERSRQLDEAQVRARVRTRFPELAAELPPRPALDTALREAGFELDWSRSTGATSCPVTCSRRSP